MSVNRLAVLALAAVLAACAAPAPAPSASSAPRFAQGGPDADEYGAREGYPIGNRGTFFSIPYLVGSHSHLDEIFEGRLIRRAGTPSSLTRAPAEPLLRHEYQGRSLTLDDYLARNPTTGLLVARGDTILIERYQYARTDRHRFTSWSMAKTVIAMLVGIAIAEGRIRSVDQFASAFVPALEDSEYGRTSLRHLLQMSSGVRFTEDYSGRDDASRLAGGTFMQLGPGGVDAVRPFNDRIVPAGTRFSYASVETQVLGLVLARAVGRPVADYLRAKIWEPIGAEADATWLLDRVGQEAASCCLNAVLRDYARLGLLLAHDGNWRGRQIIPAAWILDATSLRLDQPHLRRPIAGPFFGYGYQTWIFPTERRMFALRGIRGQAIYVDPTSRLVMVHSGVRRLPEDEGEAERVALWLAVVRDLGG